MRLSTILSLAAGLALLLPQAATAKSSPQEIHNLRCMVLLSDLSGSNDPDVREAVKVLHAYYASKIYAANPKINLQAALARESERVVMDNVDQVRQACSRELKQLSAQAKSTRHTANPAVPAAPRRPAVPPRTEAMASSTLYMRRKNNPFFAYYWEKAQQDRYDEIESFLLKVAIEGWDEEVWHEGKCVGIRRRHDPRLGLRLLQQKMERDHHMRDPWFGWSDPPGADAANDDAGFKRAI